MNTYARPLINVKIAPLQLIRAGSLVSYDRDEDQRWRSTIEENMEEVGFI